MPKATTKPQTIVESSALGDAKADLKRLSNLILRHAPYDGVFDLRLLGLHVTRVSRTRKELHHTIVEPALCLVAQGAKNILLGKDIFVYDASRMLV